MFISFVIFKKYHIIVCKILVSSFVSEEVRINYLTAYNHSFFMSFNLILFHITFCKDISTLMLDHRSQEFFIIQLFLFWVICPICQLWIYLHVLIVHLWSLIENWIKITWIIWEFLCHIKLCFLKNFFILFKFLLNLRSIHFKVKLRGTIKSRT